MVVVSTSGLYSTFRSTSACPLDSHCIRNTKIFKLCSVVEAVLQKIELKLECSVGFIFERAEPPKPVYIQNRKLNGVSLVLFLTLLRTWIEYRKGLRAHGALEFRRVVVDSTE